jgi:hypothetical protein
MFLMTQTCTISPYLAPTPRGNDYGESYITRGRLEPYKKKLVSIKGTEFVSKAIVFLPPDTKNWELKQGSLITVLGEEYEIMEIRQRSGFKPSHVECVVI